MTYDHIDNPKDCCCPNCSAERRRVQGYLALEDCKPGSIYRLRSRNLAYGVFDGARGFLGIRTKFGERFFDTEYHYDHPPWPTARPMEAVGWVTEDVPLTPTLHAVEAGTGRVAKELKPGEYVFIDTGEPVASHKLQGVRNQVLWDILEQLEKQNA